ncbi:MAG: peptidylprolyl isomerase [Anaerolineaceae bacterium]|nr:peptidylprolyl isomerase [Anaerolineaceae bacterium]
MEKNKVPAHKIVTKKHLARKEKEQRQTRIILIVTISVLAIIVGLIVYGLIDSYLVKPNKPVAHVGNDVIAVGEFDKKVKYSRLSMINQAYMYVQYSQMFGDLGSSFIPNAQSIVTQMSDTVGVGSSVLDSMIDEIIIEEEAKKLGITVSDAEIQDIKQSSFDFFPQGSPTPTITPTTVFTPTLSASQLELLQYTATPKATETPSVTSTPIEETVVPTQETNETEADAVNDEGATEQVTQTTESPTPTPYTTQGFAKEFDTYLNTLSSIGFSEKDVYEMFRAQLLRQKLLDEVTKDLQPFEDQIWARHILVASLEEAESILSRLETGESWIDLAAENSLDTGSKDSGGDLGWFGKGKMLPTFEDAAFALNEGEISEPIETQYGFHIIQLIGKANKALTSEEFESLKQTTFTNYITSIRDSRSDISIETDWSDHIPTEPEVPVSILNAIYAQ